MSRNVQVRAGLKAYEQRKVREQRDAVSRVGSRVSVVWGMGDDQKGRVHEIACASASTARAVVEIYEGPLNLGERTPPERLNAAALYAEARYYAARRRCRKHH